ncbi:MAG: amino acid ABC transporter permease [Cohaesibacteraceae bacterium]|nr:amino acid ABC transporter permease [Cohaesibacteraceae bacterium]MBL4875033.1 amino acid ABC transporter permease [Cohaesibacteraceae bacterium]
MAYVKTKDTPSRTPPLNESSVLGWLKINLFDTLYSSVLTVLVLIAVFFAVKALWVWGISDGVWIANSRRECFKISIDGACWAGIFAWFDSIFYGRYPRTDLWRIDLGGILLIVWMAPLWLPRVQGKILIGLSTVALYPFLAGYLFTGGDKGIFMQIMLSAAIVCFFATTANAIIGFLGGGNLIAFILRKTGKNKAPEKQQRNMLLTILAIGFIAVFLWQRGWSLEGVTWTRWGGLFLTFVIAGIGIASALPGGILLALGRRSKLPVVRVLCTSFIELFRSVPLITVLFMATTMFPLFMPEGFVLNKLVQVIIAVCLFNACYMAETVRAGLQAIPRGQYEGAHTIGLGYWGTIGLIIMPQALKHMIPNIVGSFIGLLKDTTLVSIIGLFDVLNILRTISRDSPWLGLHQETLVFGAMLFFIICFAMSKYSRHLEVKLSTTHKN